VHDVTAQRFGIVGPESMGRRRRGLGEAFRQGPRQREVGVPTGQFTVRRHRDIPMHKWDSWEQREAEAYILKPLKR